MNNRTGIAGTCRAHLRYWIGRLIASDPALDHLKTGVRALLSAALATVALRWLAQALGQEPKLALLGIAVPMMSMVMLRDPRPKAQWLTFLMSAPLVALGNLIGSLVVHDAWLSGALVIFIVFIAFEARRFGPRGIGLGLSLFYGYFYCLLLQSSPDKLPWQTLLLCAGYAIAGVVRFLLIPDRPQATLRHMLRAVRGRTSTLLEDMRRALTCGKPQRRLARLQSGITQLNALSLQIEDHLEQHAVQGTDPAPQRDALRESMLDGEMGVEILAGTVQGMRESDRAPADAGLRRMASLLGQLQERADRDGCFDAQAFDEGTNDPALGLAPDARWRLRRAAQLLSHGPWRLPLPALGYASATADGPAQPSQWRRIFTLDDPTRQAIRASGACLGALVAGHLISPQRWYWAVIAAFVVFIRGMTPGQTLAQAWRRVLATIAGVAGGLLLAELVQGNTTLEVVLLFAFVGIGFYLFQAANAMFVLLLTLMLAMLYELLGRYSADTMYLRLGETLAGAAMAVLAAVTIFPVRTDEHSDDKSAQLLRETAHLLRASFDHGRKASRDALRSLDRKLQALRQAIAPVTSKIYPGHNHDQQQRMRQLSRLVYYTRHVYRLVDLHGATLEHDDALGGMAKIAADNIDRLAQRLENNAGADTAAQAMPPPAQDQDTAQADAQDGRQRSRLVAHWLREINELAVTMPGGGESGGKA